jgi:hypothetical protein
MIETIQIIISFQTSNILNRGKKKFNTYIYIRSTTNDNINKKLPQWRFNSQFNLSLRSNYFPNVCMGIFGFTLICANTHTQTTNFYSKNVDLLFLWLLYFSPSSVACKINWKIKIKLLKKDFKNLICF